MNESITIRSRAEQDSEAIERVAAMDSGRAPQGDALVAIVGGELQAIMPLDGGRVLADPFRPTAHLVELLRMAARSRRPARGARVPRREELRRPLGLAPRAC